MVLQMNLSRSSFSRVLLETLLFAVLGLIVNGEAALLRPVPGGERLVPSLWSEREPGEFGLQFEPATGPHRNKLSWARSLSARRSLASGTTDFPAQCYLFSYFLGNGEDGLHLAWSRDGLRWEELNGGRTFLKPEVGESKLMRDPCLFLDSGRIFRLVWTTSWGGKTIGYASSEDLIHWSAQKAIPVMAAEPAALNCWAPEVFWNPQKQDFLIFWASTVTNKFLETAGRAEDKYNHRFYCASTKDFRTFSPTRLFYDPGFNVIDATLLAANGRYHLIFKDETLKPPRKHLRVATSDSPEGPFSLPSPAFTRDWVEGPTAVRVGEEFLVYFDCYRDNHYGAMKSKDLVHWEDVTPRLSMPAGVRHGTALAVPGHVIQVLREMKDPKVGN